MVWIATACRCGWVLLINAVLMVPAEQAADEAECPMPKFLSCYNCDSRKDSFCEDKFNKTDSISLRNTKDCEGECLKWVRQVDPEDPNTDWYILRLCKSDVAIEMYLSPDMCIGESRPGSGQMCTCQEDRCNHAPTLLITNNIGLILSAAAALMIMYT